MSLVTSSCTISGDQAHLEHWVSGADTAPNYSEEEARPRQAVQKVPKPLLGQIFPCNFVEFNPNVGPSTILANLFELPFMSCFKHASVESNVCLFKIPRHRENLFCSRGVFLYLCFFDGLFPGADPIRPSEADNGRHLLLEMEEKEGFATDWRSHSEGDRVDMLLMASGDLVLTRCLNMSGLKIGGKKREADNRGMCAVTYKKINKDG